jgi:transglutaminase/protease-like cytokinesis protein 3
MLLICCSCQLFSSQTKNTIEPPTSSSENPTQDTTLPTISTETISTETEISTEETQTLTSATWIDDEKLHGIYDFTDPQAGVYAYYSLTPSAKRWYQDIEQILGQMSENKELSAEGLKEGLTQADIETIFQCVMNDHPEFFYVDGYSYTVYESAGKTVKIELSGTYNVSFEEAKRREALIQEEVERILSGIDPYSIDYRKIKYVYETLIANTEYNIEASDNQNIYSVFVNHESVCQGYAKAAQYLLGKLDVEATLVIGEVHNGEGHAWNLVRSNGDYYYFDATWGDASYQNDTSREDETPSINYDYLCVTTDEILATHIVGSVVAMPVCTAIADNYYVREGKYFTSYDTTKLSEFFAASIEAGEKYMSFKCDDYETYLTIEEELITKKGIFDYLSGSIAYVQNPDHRTLSFWVTMP